MKVKHFFCDDREAFSGILEKQINDFVKDKKVIDIKYSSSVVSSGVGIHEVNYGALIMYES